MRYRTLGRTGFQVSEIGLGGEYLEGQPLKQVCDTVDAAMDAGINLLDCFMSNPEIRSDLATSQLSLVPTLPALRLNSALVLLSVSAYFTNARFP